jgi:hypothetical protein
MALRPFNDPKNELTARPPNADPNDAYIRLRYDWSAEEAIDPQRWQPHLLAYHKNETYTEILGYIEEYIHERLIRLEPGTHDRLDRNKSCIVL